MRCNDFGQTEVPNLDGRIGAEEDCIMVNSVSADKAREAYCFLV